MNTLSSISWSSKLFPNKPSLSNSLYVATLTSLLALTGCSDPKETTAADASQTEATTASDDVITLRFSHFMTASDDINEQVFVPWAKKIEEESNGRLKIEIYPSATLSKPGVTYEAAAKGTIDIGMQAHGYTAGRFPLTQILELPGLSNTAAQQTCILHKLYDDGVISKEYEDSHMLYMIGTGPGALHTIDKPIRTPADMKGLRIRQPSAVASYIIQTVGAAPVGMPAPDTYTSLQRGVIDGLSFAWQPVRAFRLDELVNTHTNIPFYSAALVVTMNKDKYQSLPDDLKKIIDDNSGITMAAKAAQVFDMANNEIMAEARAKGDVMIEVPDPLNDPDWSGPLIEGSQKYLDEVKATGLDAQSVYEKAKEASIACKT